MLRWITAFCLLLLVACAPDGKTPTYEVPLQASEFAAITFEGVGSIDVLAQMSVAMNETNSGFIFKGYNQYSTAINAFWSKVAGQSAQVYFVANDVNTNDRQNRTVLSVVTDPGPPPLVETFKVSLRDLLLSTIERLKLDPKQVKVVLK
jgi:uncharacterized lipoprotein YmbA